MMAGSAYAQPRHLLRNRKFTIGIKLFRFAKAKIHTANSETRAQFEDARQRQDDLCIVESRKRAFLVQSRNGRKIGKTTFLGCEAFSLISQNDASGRQKALAQFVDGYLSLLGPR
jgi:hypothetical protein